MGSTHATGRDVLAHLTEFDVESTCATFVEQLAVDQVHQPKIRLGRIPGHARAMLNRDAEVRVVCELCIL